MPRAEMSLYVLGKGHFAHEAGRADPLSRRQCDEARRVDLVVILLHVAAELGCAVDDGRLQT